MNISTRQMIEKGIAKRVVRAAIEAGFMVSLFNGGDWVVTKSRKLSEVVGAMFTVDEESLMIYADGRAVGVVQFVYGNDGYDAIADHTATIEMETLLSDANKYAESMEFTFC